MYEHSAHVDQDQLNTLLVDYARGLGAEGDVNINYTVTQKIRPFTTPTPPKVSADAYWHKGHEVVPKPEVICLCGSTRFYDEFMEANYNLTMAGKIVLSVGFFHHQAEKVHGEGVACTDEQKVMLDELHKRKIDLADTIFVINKGGYIGDSTRSEIEYAESHGKKILYQNPAELSKFDE
jgi:hypothetical protein